MTNRAPNLCIRDITLEIGNFTVVAKVVAKSKTKAVIEDDTGRITLNLHGKQIQQVQVGQTIKISGAFAQTKDGFMEISSWKEIESIQKSAFKSL
ncbi:MAG: hypothetical protein NWE96_04355 [Candidatus Bathyarchaeota archaeon]|nr:hypothetical protein [Candidatus Bathyarchaeota archaeon]